jgi:hypothetical protein
MISAGTDEEEEEQTLDPPTPQDVSLVLVSSVPHIHYQADCESAHVLEVLLHAFDAPTTLQLLDFEDGIVLEIAHVLEHPSHVESQFMELLHCQLKRSDRPYKQHMLGVNPKRALVSS